MIGTPKRAKVPKGLKRGPQKHPKNTCFWGQNTCFGPQKHVFWTPKTPLFGVQIGSCTPPKRVPKGPTKGLGKGPRNPRIAKSAKSAKKGSQNDPFLDPQNRGVRPPPYSPQKGSKRAFWPIWGNPETGCQSAPRVVSRSRSFGTTGHPK